MLWGLETTECEKKCMGMCTSICFTVTNETHILFSSTLRFFYFRFCFLVKPGPYEIGYVHYYFPMARPAITYMCCLIEPVRNLHGKNTQHASARTGTTTAANTARGPGRWHSHSNPALLSCSETAARLRAESLVDLELHALNRSVVLGGSRRYNFQARQCHGPRQYRHHDLGNVGSRGRDGGGAY